MSIDDPKLAYNTESIDPKIGRLYHRPGIEIPEGLTVDEIRELVNSETLVPSTTNVIGVKNAPYLMKWATKIGVQAALNDIIKRPILFENMTDIRYQKATDHYTSQADKIRDAAGLKGSNVHLFCEYEAKKLPTPVPFENLTREEQIIIDHWRRWLDIYQPDFQFVEVTGFGQIESGKQYAQTTDFIANIKGVSTIGDYKCVVNDTKIMLEDGSLVEAQSLKEGDRVASWSERKGLHSSRVSYVGDNGKHPTVSVTTRTGHNLRTTGNHPYWVTRNKKSGWLMAEELKIGDSVYIAYGWDHTPNRDRNNDTAWPFNRNLSPYLYAVLWSLAQYNNVEWEESTFLELPSVSRETLADELKFVGFVFNKEGKISLKRAVNKIARKNGISFEEVAGLMTSKTLPDYVHSLDELGKQAFLTGIREVYANRELFPDEINIMFKEEEAIRELQQFILNYGLPAVVEVNNNAIHPHLVTTFEDNSTIYTHGPQATRIVDIEYHDEPESTVAIEVEGSHIHITNGIITHNTNRSGVNVDASLQLAANARTSILYVDDVLQTPQPKVDRGVVLHLSAKGARMFEVDISDKIFEAFSGLRSAWDFYAFSDYDKWNNTQHSPIIREINGLKDF